MNATATLSPDGLYRYDLTRRWGEGRPALWIMLNPSTADAEVDDPTINRCLSFSRRTGAGALTVVNLFAFRSTDPAGLTQVRDPVGPDNWPTIQRHLAADPLVVIAAWGANEAVRRSIIRLKLMDARVPILCLGRTAGGHPRHPGRIAATTELVTYQEVADAQQA